jgi:hypothetical protein
MDWDDDDEKTTLWDKSGGEDASRDLLRSAPPPPPPAAGAPARPGAPSRPGGAAAIASASGGAAPALPRPAPPAPPPPPAPAPLPRPAVPAQMMAPQPGGGKGLIIVIGLAAVLLAVVAVVLFAFPASGTLIVTVAGPNDEVVEKVQVFVDQQVACSTSTCKVEKLSAGTHIVSVQAEGYKKTADKAITVQKGQNVVLPISLTRKSRGTGIRVAELGSGLRLTVDGNDEGPLPAELKEMTPGEHSIRISGSDRYETYEGKVNVEPDKIVSVEPKLKVIKGLAHIKPGPGADGAKVLLVSGRERRPLPKLPIKIDIRPEKPYTLVAKKQGYQTYRKPISFDDGRAEKTFEIVMVAEGEEVDEDEPQTKRTGGKRRAVASRKSTKSSSSKSTAAAGGGGRLNINSIPASNVILDGRPLGQTPKIGISVSAGSHTVMFVHPEHGRKIQSVRVKAGGTATAAVRFP